MGKWGTTSLTKKSDESASRKLLHGLPPTVKRAKRKSGMTDKRPSFHGQDGIATLLHQPFRRTGCSADSNSSHTALQPLGVDFVGALDEMAVVVDASALVEQHSTVAALAATDEENEFVAGSKGCNVRHSVGNLTANGVETAEPSAA